MGLQIGFPYSVLPTTEGATFEPYSEVSHTKVPDVTPDPAPTPAPADPPPSEIPEQILQVAWFLMALMNEHPDANKGLLQQIQQQPIGQLRDLRRDRVDHTSAQSWGLRPATCPAASSQPGDRRPSSG